MFIKWRVYQRQTGHKKGDKYRLQPVLVKSYRPTKKRFKKWAEREGVSKAEFMKDWEERKDELNRPRHFQLYRFPSFASCDYVYYDKPAYIENRRDYWEMLDILFKHNRLLSELSEEEKTKIVDEIESILPRPYGALLEILERAYEAGMPRSQSPREYYETKKM